MPGRFPRALSAAAVVLSVALRAIPADALDPTKRITQYVFDSWQMVYDPSLNHDPDGDSSGATIRFGK